MHLSDVTLREGDQMPGRAYSVAQKVDAGHRLDDLGVDYIQAGFPITGEQDQDAIRQLTTKCNAQIIALSRAIPQDVEAAVAATADVIEVFVPISELQLEYTLKKPFDDVLAQAREAVDLASDHGAIPHLTLVDAFRTAPDRLRETTTRFEDVEYITLADTVGARTPVSVHRLLTELESDIDLSRLGVHFHDDLGVATANVLAAYEAGVGKADVSVASLGERAGNPAIEEVVVAGVVEHDDPFGVDESLLVPACEDVLTILDENDVAGPRKAILGSEVTEHESGIHTAAMLEEPSVFEPYDPDVFGGERRLLFGSGTGTSGAATLLAHADVDQTDEHIEKFLSLLADVGPVTEDEALSLAESEM